MPENENSSNNSGYDPNCEACPECGSIAVTATNIQDKAFSIHYIDDIADYTCNNCGHTWTGQYGYKGLA